ncbi:MAG TPA: hypothetical protein VF816_06000 [Rhodocyclaceae bacterium]
MRIAAIAIVLSLSGCGVADVGTTAATTAKLQADAAKQGQQTMEKMQADIDAAQKAEQQRIAAGAAQAQR